jgi:hypothetical protein
VDGCNWYMWRKSHGYCNFRVPFLDRTASEEGIISINSGLLNYMI